MTAHVLHTWTASAGPVRFFRSHRWPAADWPWVDLPALLRAVGLESDDAAFFLHRLQQDWPGLARRLAASDGIALCVPLMLCGTLLDAMPLPQGRREAFEKEASHAMRAATAHLPGAGQRVAWAVTASTIDHTGGACPEGAA